MVSNVSEQKMKEGVKEHTSHLQTYLKLEKCACLYWYFARRIEQILLGFFR